MNQRENSPAVAKKLKIEACFPKRAKRPRFARLTRLVLNGKHLQFSLRFFAKGRNYLHVNENDKLIIKNRADIWSARIVIEGFLYEQSSTERLQSLSIFWMAPV